MCRFVAYFIVIFVIEGNIRISPISLLSSFCGFFPLITVIITGNDKLHHLLSQGTYEMRMNMEDFDNETRYVKYSSFNVGNESTKYTFTVSGFSGNVGERFFSIRCVSDSFVDYAVCLNQV